LRKRHKQKLLEFQKKHKSIEFTEIEEEVKIEKKRNSTRKMNVRKT
jgi:hypothetical protein